jgi:hypothetical protein
MTRIFEKFGASLRNLEKELSHGRLEILPELWVYARMMMGGFTDELRESTGFYTYF